jgi:Mg-chelatase subunit ChlD
MRGEKVIRKKMIGIVLILLMAILPVGDAVAQLTAGDFDDKINYDYFLEFIEDMQQSNNDLPKVHVKDRVTIHIIDSIGQNVCHAFVSITKEGKTSPLIETYAGSDGIFYFFPKRDGAGDTTKFTVKVKAPGSDEWSSETQLDLDDLNEDRKVEIILYDTQSSSPDSLDLMLVMDTTGSMSDELNYLKDEFKNIISTIEDMYPQISMRFGLIVYRDVGDDYVVRHYEFTDSLEKMQDQLEKQKADGGGDYPEAMDQALEKAVEYQWRGKNTVRMMFLVADAPPHDNKLDRTLDAVYEARQKGIHIYPLAASGVRDTAEYIMRIAGVLTHGRYLFLTDDSGIGNSHAEPHIPAYVVTTLDSLFVRVVRTELLGYRIEPTEEEIIRKVGTLENGVVVEEDEVVENGTSTSEGHGEDYASDSAADYDSGDSLSDGYTLYAGGDESRSESGELGVSMTSSSFPFVFFIIMGMLIIGVSIIARKRKGKMG